MTEKKLNIGDIVVHYAYGSGIILKFEDDRIKIRFFKGKLESEFIKNNIKIRRISTCSTLRNAVKILCSEKNQEERYNYCDLLSFAKSNELYKVVDAYKTLKLKQYIRNSRYLSKDKDLKTTLLNSIASEFSVVLQKNYYKLARNIYNCVGKDDSHQEVIDLIKIIDNYNYSNVKNHLKFSKIEDKINYYDELFVVPKNNNAKTYSINV